MKSTPEMRDRIRELMTDPQDDYDRAVECVLDDLEGLLHPAQAAVVPDCVHPECDDPEWCAGEPKCRYGSDADLPTAQDVRGILPQCSAATEGETKTVYVKRWRTLVKLPAKYADEIVAALRIPVEPQTVTWRTDFENAPSEAYEFFLVRPQGNHPGRGGPFHPTIVQRIDGKFYTSDNELDPIYFGQDEPDDSPMKTTLEWKPLPADWLTSSSLSRPESK